MIVYHLPMLAIAKNASARMLGGKLRRFRFEEFEEVDEDWANEKYFVKGTAVWVTKGTLRDMDRDDELIRRVELIRLAAMAVLGEPFASPRLTIRYFGLGKKSCGRRIGAFERTLLLSDRNRATADRAALKRIGALVEAWRAAGYDADHPVFGALDAFGAVYTSLNARPELRIMPTMVALEGIFAPAHASGIARRMAASLSPLLVGEPALTASVRRLYNIRSDIIHGRAVQQNAVEAIGSVGALACRATLALMDRLIGEKIPPNDWTSVLEPQP